MKTMTPFQQTVNLLRLCLRPRRRLLTATLVMVVAFNAVELSFPKLLQLFVDSVAGNPLRLWGLSLDFLDSGAARVLLIPAALLVLAGARWAITRTRAVYETRLGQGALFDLRSRIFNTMQNLSFAYHDASHSGTLISNVVEDVNYANMFFMLLIESVAYFVISWLVMLAVCPQAAVAVLVLTLGGLGVVWSYLRYGHRIYAVTKQLYARTVQIFSENMEGYLVVKGFGAEDSQQAEYNAAVDRLHDNQIKEAVFSAWLNQSLALLTLLGVPLIIAVALYEARAGRWEYSAGRLFMLFYLQTGLRGRAWGLARSLELLLRFAITAERLGRLLDADFYLEARGTAALPEGPLGLDVENVSFSYGGSAAALREVNISIPAGGTVALAGPPGAGKSTLALLLCRFYDPAGGRILLNGRDIREYSIEQLRASCSLVFQDTFLFSASVRDNIAYGRPDARFEDIVYAATVAGIHEHIVSMPQGYDTVIGERGVTLSGGQRQRISIARAILRQPRFLVLDACTSALDNATEQSIQRGLATLRDSTTLIIAHRYSSIRHADMVYVLRDGRIEESGTPQQLNRPGTFFSRIMQS